MMSSTAETVGILDSPCVTLELDSRPETLTLVRGMLGGVGELLAVDPELLDDLKTAVSEACNNVVLHAYPEGAPGTLSVHLYALEAALAVVVCDDGRGIPAEVFSDAHAQGVGIPVIRALTEASDFRMRSGGGTQVSMRFAGERDGRSLFEPPARALPDDGWSLQLTGDAVASVSPVVLLGTVLGRLARALAATARFSLDRFSDVYLVTDAIAAHAEASAREGRVAFALTAGARRLEVAVGPLRAGSGERIRQEASAGGRRSPLGLLSDELEVENLPGSGELLRVVMIDHRRWLTDPVP
jgi:anti-sigma regulatory factor (Ser/Thr protein kinase)